MQLSPYERTRLIAKLFASPDGKQLLGHLKVAGESLTAEAVEEAVSSMWRDVWSKPNATPYRSPRA